MRKGSPLRHKDHYRGFGGHVSGDSLRLLLICSGLLVKLKSSHEVTPRCLQLQAVILGAEDSAHLFLQHTHMYSEESRDALYPFRSGIWIIRLSGICRGIAQE